MLPVTEAKEHTMKSPSTTKRIIYSALAGIGVTAGGAGLASAATSQSPPPATSQLSPQANTDSPEPGDTADVAGNDAEDPSYQSSITVPETPDIPGASDGEQGEAAKLAPLAKVTPEQATAAATAKVPGSAGAVQLEDENGNVVYGVEVTTPDGKTVDVKVDAGTGAVVHQESDSGNDNEAGNDSGEVDAETNDDSTTK
jgi:uncharacterized membrane protein YkoI